MIDGSSVPVDIGSIMEKKELPGIVSELTKNSMNAETMIPAKNPRKIGGDSFLRLYIESVAMTQAISAGINRSKKKCIAKTPCKLKKHRMNLITRCFV